MVYENKLATPPHTNMTFDLLSFDIILNSPAHVKLSRLLKPVLQVHRKPPSVFTQSLVMSTHVSALVAHSSMSKINLVICFIHKSLILYRICINLTKCVDLRSILPLKMQKYASPLFTIDKKGQSLRSKG